MSRLLIALFLVDIVLAASTSTSGGIASFIGQGLGFSTSTSQSSTVSSDSGSTVLQSSIASSGNLSLRLSATIPIYTNSTTALLPSTSTLLPESSIISSRSSTVSDDSSAYSLHTSSTSSVTTSSQLSATASSYTDNNDTTSSSTSSSIPAGSGIVQGQHSSASVDNTTTVSQTLLISSGNSSLQLSATTSAFINTTSAVYSANSTLLPGSGITSAPTTHWTVAPSGQGSAYVSACNHEWNLYSSASYLSWGVIYSTLQPVTNYSASLTTLCDGYPRLVGNLTATGVWYTSTEADSSTSYTGAKPTCSVDEADCLSLYNAYTTIEDIWGSSLDTWTSDAANPTPPTPPDYPACTLTGTGSQRPDTCGACTVYGGTVQLYYFPVTANISRNMCATAPAASTACPFGPTTPLAANDSSAQIATACDGHCGGVCSYYPFTKTSTKDTGPYTVLDGQTYYGNRAYVSYATAFATDSCGPVGGSYAGGLLTVPSSHVYSLSGWHYAVDTYAYSFNFADLNTPIPASGYLAMPQCDGHISQSRPNPLDRLNGNYFDHCSVIIDDWFAPQLALFPEFYELDPAWSRCELALEGLFDPPKALSPASSLATVTVPVPVSSSTPSASPAPSPTSPTTTTPAPISSTTTTAASIGNSVPTSTKPTQQSGSAESVAPSSQATSLADSDPGSSAAVSSQTSSAQGDGAQSSSISKVSSQTEGSDPSQSQETSSQSSSANPGDIIVSVVDHSTTAIGQASSSAVGSSVGAQSTPSQGQSHASSGSGQTSSADPGGVIVSVIDHSSTAISGQSSAVNVGESPSNQASQDPGSSSENIKPSSVVNPASSVVAVGSSSFTLAPTTDAVGSPVIVVAAGGSSAILTSGQVTSLGGQIVSAGGSGAVVGTGIGATTVILGDSNAGSSISPYSSSDPGSGNNIVAVGSSTFTVAQSTNAAGSSVVIVAAGGSSATLSPGQVTSLGGQVVSARGSGAVIGTGIIASTVDVSDPNASSSISPSSGSDPGPGSSIVAVGSSTFTVAQSTNAAGSSVVIVAAGGSTATLNPGQVTSLGGQAVSAGVSGAVIGTGISASTVVPSNPEAADPGDGSIGTPSSGSVPTPGNSVVTVGSSIFTVAPTTNSAGSSIIVVVAGGSTATLAQGQTTILGGQEISAAGNGAVIGNGNSATTVLPDSSVPVSSSAGDDTYQVGGQTVSAGGSAAIVSGTTYFALGSGSGIRVAANEVTSTAFAPSTTQDGPVSSANGYDIAGTTLQAGSSAIVVAGTTYSALPSGSGVVVQSAGGSSTVLADPSAAITALSASGEYAVARNTLTAGGAAATISGATYSVLPSGGGVQIVQNGVTSILYTGNQDSSTQADAAASITPLSASNAYVVAGQTITAGGAPITVSGTTFSALPSGSGVQEVQAGITSVLQVGNTNNNAPSSITIGSDVLSYQPLGSNAALIGSETLTANGASVTEGGQTLELISQSSGLALVINGTATTPLPVSTEGTVQLNGQVFTVYPGGSSKVVIDGQTVVPGYATAIYGATLSLQASDLLVIDGTSTSTEVLGTPLSGPITTSSAAATDSVGAASGPTSTSGVGRRWVVSYAGICFAVCAVLSGITVVA
ncbi:hypothetical protein LTR56_003594 [Elasticomyces elasticus]|nr:hypothetical protein LTR56_003594 [Elasticomyces elasticus]KAK3663728.1 hypothetical protein LTR22_005429 [Elasticomyces elasticus]KAK4927246.1 hypothetical protein LTR49_005911 [Elasticomyces elasticus]KAK5767348.1 hypothetical protein LTS12_002501 [Elasticomyces elasticus]